MVSDAIRSALSQSYKNTEVLVVDNASTDTIRDVVASIRDPRLKLFINSRNLGLFGNFNRCIELAEGKYVHILHSDDTIEPHFTETCVRFLEVHPSVTMTFTAAEVLVGGTREDLRLSENDLIFTAPDGFRKILKARNFIVCPSVMIRKSVYEDLGMFSLEYPFSADYYQWLKISRHYDIAYIADARVIYRQGNHSESFRLQFSSPTGYLDTQKILIQLLVDLGDERQNFLHDLNTALYIFIRDCLFAGFTRSDRMKTGNAGIFWGIALGCWGFIAPLNLAEWPKKMAYLPLILGAGLFMQVRLIRSFVRMLFRKNDRFY